MRPPAFASKPSRTSFLSTLAAIAVAAAVLLLLLGHKPLADWDEAIYAEVAREFLGQSWLVPHWHFQPWFEKPPLGLWITAIFFHFFGVTRFWARAETAFCSIGLVGVIHAVALRLRGQLAAWISTVVLLSSFGFLRVARMGELDAPLALACIAALIGLEKLRRGAPQGWYWFWGGFGLALMTKGAASVTLPLTAGLAVLATTLRVGGGNTHREARQPHGEQREHGFFGHSFFGGVGLFCLLVLPWHLYMLHGSGAGFLREYLGLHVIARATSQIEGHVTPWWFYGKVLLAYAVPWVALFPWVLWRGFRRPELRVWAIFAAVVLVFFSAVATRSPKYIFPSYPPLALLIGDALAEKLAGATGKTLAAFAVGAALVCVLLDAATQPLRESLTTARSAAGAALHEDRESAPLLKAALADPAIEALPGPILLWRDDAVAQLPALLFEIQRPLQQVYAGRYPETMDEARRYADPQPLASLVGREPRLILFKKDLETKIPAAMVFHPITAGGTEEAGTIVLREKK
jgi:4-amino-4-deoxy-L-arabinose transferase-like glycosyltransferase